MSEDVAVALIAALIPAVASVIVQLVMSSSRKKETDAAMAVHEQKQTDAIEAINKELGEVKAKLDEHNNYAKKFGDIDKNIALIQKDVEHLQKQK